MAEKTERVPRPEEVLETQEDLTPEQKIQPLRCRAGSGTKNPCPREAATWIYPEDRDYPLCDEHAAEAGDWGLAEEITGDCLRIARSWGLGQLEQLAINAHDATKEKSLKAEARMKLAEEIADAPRKGPRGPSSPGAPAPHTARRRAHERLHDHRGRPRGADRGGRKAGHPRRPPGRTEARRGGV